jgi:AcrR family transcriptional regulator
MAEAEKSPDRRCRGRPQLRTDVETRQIIYAAARHEFAANGYAATSTEKIARRAGISTKTLYRLIPAKSDLFEGMVADRLDRFFSDVSLRTAHQEDIDQALIAALLSCTDLVLDPEVVALQRIVLQEAGNFPNLAATYYSNGIVRTATALADWLTVQMRRGLLELEDPKEAAGMLIGMVASAPQRAAIYGGVPLPSRAEVERRVRSCAALFLHGCRTSGGTGTVLHA